jgi:dipeptidyl aminopeptidase/acylaminoacyl peptidase
VPTDQSDRLVAILEANEVPVKYVRHPEWKHSWADPGSTSGEYSWTLINMTLKFFDTYLKGK